MEEAEDLGGCVILRTRSKRFPVVVVSISRTRLYSLLEKVGERLGKTGYSGRVLFDQIGCNGTGRSRFQISIFDGNRFSLTRRIMEEDIDRGICEDGKRLIEIYGN